MIKGSQEGERAGAGLMSRVTVLIDWGSREVPPVCSTDPSWFLHIAFFNYTKCSARVTGNLGTDRRWGHRSVPYIMRSTLCMKIWNTSQLGHHSENVLKSLSNFSAPPLNLLVAVTAVAWLDMKCSSVICSCCCTISLRCVQALRSARRERWFRDKTLRDTLFTGAQRELKVSSPIWKKKGYYLHPPSPLHLTPRSTFTQDKT